MKGRKLKKGAFVNLVAISLALFFIGCQAKEEPSTSRPGGRIAFVAGLGQTVELWEVEANGQEATRLPTPPRPEKEPDRGFHGETFPGPARTYPNNPAWSPDGTRIAFELGGMSFSEIWVMKADGREPKRLTSPTWGASFQPKWSPDGKKLAFALFSFKNKQHDIFVMDADGRNLTNLTRTIKTDENFPAWSPDGKKILFSSTDQKHPGIWIMDADGGNRLPLIPARKGTNAAGSWSPDGKKIVYTSNQNGNWDIWVMDLEEKKSVNLTADWPEDETDPIWSPDGTAILFVSRRGDRHWQLWIMGADGRGRRLFYGIDDPPKGFNKYQPAWSPQ